MKKTLVLVAIALVSIACMAENKPVKFEHLPSVAREFISVNFPGVDVSYAFKDDDIIRPDYEVRLANGVEITFDHSGSLDKISASSGIPDGIVPVQIADYVKSNYSSVSIIEYEVGRKEYEVKISNGLELKFNGNFRLKSVDD